MKRFWKKVETGGVDECWAWNSSLDSCGYGTFWLNANVKAHRVAYELTFGEIPEGQHVLHKCDNPRCCNPNHLFLGTHEENMKDMARKGRALSRPGEKNPSSKLTSEDVMFIRESGDRQERLAECFGVTQQTISNIKTGKTWKHIGGL